MSASILVIDVETQRAVVETFGIFKPYITVDRIIRDSRLLCFAAKFRGEEKIYFKSCWEDDDEESYVRMLQSAWDLMNQADIVVGFNSDKFDLQWLEEQFGRYGLGRPDPYKSVDLRKTQQRHFKAGLLSGKLEWSARTWLKDRKTPHGGTDLWHDIRYGTREERRVSCRIMKEYNIHDVVLTEKLFEAYLPWITNVNLAQYNEPDDETIRCTKCNSTNVHRRGIKYFYTLAGAYQLWRCSECGATSKGSKRDHMSTELRPV